ncbi:MAG: YqaE/Pmp3 family membrane protein [Tatlockia sp.]|jgi:Na+/melibiose symporter-like transporter
MIRNLLTFFAALFFPWLVLLFKDNPGGALLALVMQASIIGWIPASMWAWRSMRETQKERAEKKRNAKIEKANKKKESLEK